jgi:hypothetical protein
MARSLLITIEDNAVAESLAYDISRAETHGMPILPQGTVVEAVAARPTRWCKCSATAKRRGRQKPVGDYTQVPKFGWWVHALCMKPEKNIIDNWIQNHLNGCVNLLPGIVDRYEKRRAALRGDVR